MKLDIPDAARFGISDEGGVHIIDGFNDTWCVDTLDDEGKFIEHVEIHEFVSRPESDDGLCVDCVRSAKDED